MVNKFIVSPMSQTISLKAGETYQGTLSVSNPADATEDFYFKVAVSPYSITDDSYTPDFETTSEWSNIVNWTKLDVDTGVLKPNETKKINFTIKVPESASAGGQYMMIGVSSDPNANTDSGTTVRDVYEMASLVLAEIDGKTVHDGRIISNSLPGFVATGVPKTEVVASNNGNIHEIITTTITIKNVFTGQNMIEADGEKNVYETVVMPGSTRTVTRDLEGLPQLGIFEVEQSVSYLGDNSSTSTILVLCPIWFIVLVIATVASIVGMICYGLHLKHKKNQKSS
ncbi:hypothetical protein IKG24_01250 [Candidatus Saccharibacteria bacterium]|nr:hypothetical protein [Candidatus Saccharibacteria bacterium]